MTKLPFKIASVVGLCLITFLSIAQPGGDPNGGNKPGIPIGGIEILLVAGGAFGISRLVSRRSKK